MGLTTVICFAVFGVAVLGLPASQDVIGARTQDEGTLPLPPFNGPDNVTLYLYTQGNPSEPEKVTLDDSTSPSFDPSNPTRVVIHGWISSYQGLQGFKNAFLATGEDYNVILVDWAGPAFNLVEISWRLSVLVGDYVGKVLNHLIDERGLNVDTLHIIGHSMGGQMAGIVGNRVGGGAAQEVIALDPAADLYENNPLEDKLDPSDGKFVQVIHTNGGGLGMLENRGHADFFPNGGSHQEGCGPEDPVGGCSHNLAVDFFIESINSNSFVATSCSSYNEYRAGLCKDNAHELMGEWTPLNISGTFYLNTNEEPPYGQGYTEL